MACDCCGALVLCAWVVSVASCSGVCVSCVVSAGELVAWCFARWGFVALRAGAILLPGRLAAFCYEVFCIFASGAFCCVGYQYRACVVCCVGFESFFC